MNEINPRPTNKTCVFYGFSKLQIRGETEFEFGIQPTNLRNINYRKFV